VVWWLCWRWAVAIVPLLKLLRELCRSLAGVCCCGCVDGGICWGRCGSGCSGSARDAAEIKAALDGTQAAWNHHDMTAFCSYMTDDVEWVNVVGMRWKGKAQVIKAHDSMHKTIFKTRELHDAQLEDLRQIAPGVVIATSVIPADGYTTLRGTTEPADRNVLTEVFVQRGGKWLVISGHNTTINEAALAHDPGK
jgi:uncharacterized protein (TIGR02246 family)